MQRLMPTWLRLTGLATISRRPEGEGPSLPLHQWSKQNCLALPYQRHSLR